MSELITVGISDLNVVKEPDTLVTYALGSCVGICLYDPMAKVAGLAHIMLPSSVQSSCAAQKMKFADTAPAILVVKMIAKGAAKPRLCAKIAGGAQMFASPAGSLVGNIGQRNIDAVKASLHTLNIPIVAEDVGSNYGRTLYFDAASGTMRIKSGAHGEATF